MDLVTVAVPIYNCEKFLERCILSIIDQTYTNLEILLINDGSPDHSQEIMEKYKEKDNRIKCFYKKNSGIADTRNFAVKHATGKYLFFVDSDDWIVDTCIEKMVKKQHEENADLVVCEFDRLYNKKTTRNTINMYDILGFKNTCVWNKLYILDNIKKNHIEFPKGIWYEDLTMLSNYIMVCQKVSIIHESLYLYWQNENSIMHTYDDRIFQIFEALEKIEQYAKKRKLYDKHKEGIEFATIYHVLVGTIYRFSFHKDFSVEGIKKIVEQVEKKFPKWYHNKLIKENLPFYYSLYLNLLRRRMYRLTYFLFKCFNRFLYL